ncbi:hypothetical protein H9P43_001436 [Blastocladiella emersonii ATCC 22665]|nr:hypothetical protein H9P43_001436 [Blastocladiella emersonii ATCC 22665]
MRRNDQLLQPWSKIPVAPKYFIFAILVPFIVNTINAYTCHSWQAGSKWYLISPVPLMAGFASFYVAPDFALPMQMIGYGVMLAQTIRMWWIYRAPLWFPTLRGLLAMVAVGALGATWFANKWTIARRAVLADIKESGGEQKKREQQKE